MSKTRDTGYLANVIQVHDTGVRIMSGSEMLMAISSSGAVTITGELSGSDAANSLLLNGTGSVGFTTTGSFLAVSSSYTSLSASYNTFSGSASTRISNSETSSNNLTNASASFSSRTTQIENVYATTGSNSFRATQSITGSLTVTGQIIAQTLNVQQVTSSIVYSSGSNVFGCDINSRQTFTGSFYQTGSVANFSNQVCIGNATTAQRSLVVQAGSTNQAIMFKNASGGDGTLYICGNATATHYGFNTYACADVLFIANGGSIGIGCNNPGYTLDVNGTGHFSSTGGTMLIESTQPTNASTLKIIQCSTGGNGNTDQGLVVQTNAGDGTSNIANFYDYNNGSPVSRVRFLRSGVVCFSGNVCMNTLTLGLNASNIFTRSNGSTYCRFLYAGSNLHVVFTGGSTANGGAFGINNYEDTDRIFNVLNNGITQIGNNTCINGALVASTICATSYTFGGNLICASQVRIGNHGYNTGYVNDGIWGSGATPSYIIGTGYSSGFYMGYLDNGSGLYGAAYGFSVRCTDGANNKVQYDAIRMRNAESGAVPFYVTNWGNIYGTSKNFRIDHPIPSMKDTHYLVHTSIEGPQADLIYRGKVQLVDGKAEVNIDEASRMTNGTFEALCQDVQSYTTNESGWSLTKSYVVGNVLHIEAQDTTVNDTISWLVIGERKDDGMKYSTATDENNHVIVELLKPEE